MKNIGQSLLLSQPKTQNFLHPWWRSYEEISVGFANSEWFQSISIQSFFHADLHGSHPGLRREVGEFRGSVRVEAESNEGIQAYELVCVCMCEFVVCWFVYEGECSYVFECDINTWIEVNFIRLSGISFLYPSNPSLLKIWREAFWHRHLSSVHTLLLQSKNCRFLSIKVLISCLLSLFIPI